MKKMNYQMIKANLDESLEIKEIDKYAIHVELTRVTVIPGRKIPSVAKYVKCFPVKTFVAMEAMRTAKQPIVWYRAGGFDEARVIHDGRLLKEEPKETSKVSPEVQEVIAREVKKVVKGKPKKTFLS